MTKAEEKRNSQPSVTRGEFIRYASISITVFLASCIDTKPTNEPYVPIQPLPADIPPTPPPTNTPKSIVIAEEEPTVEPTPNFIEEATGGAYTEKQIEQAKQQFKDRYDQIIRVKETLKNERAIQADASVGLNHVLLLDKLGEEGKVVDAYFEWVVLSGGGYNPGTTIIASYAEGHEGEPLWLSPQGASLVFGKDVTRVGFNAETGMATAWSNGEIVGFVNELGTWTEFVLKPTQTPEPTSEPTETSTPEMTAEQKIEIWANEIREFYQTEERELAPATLEEEGRDTWARGQSFWSLDLKEGLDPSRENPSIYSFRLNGRLIVDCGFDPSASERRVFLMSVNSDPHYETKLWITAEKNYPEPVPDDPSLYGEWAGRQMRSKIISSVPLLVGVLIESDISMSVLREDGVNKEGDAFSLDIQTGDTLSVGGSLREEEYLSLLNKIHEYVEKKPPLAFLGTEMALHANGVRVWRGET